MGELATPSSRPGQPARAAGAVAEGRLAPHLLADHLGNASILFGRLGDS